MLPPPSSRSGVRLAEMVAALSLATDLGMGQPLEFALRTCVLAVRLGELLGLHERELRDIYYVALLRSAARLKRRSKRYCSATRSLPASGCLRSTLASLRRCLPRWSTA